jgi:hypothetical protein
MANLVGVQVTSPISRASFGASNDPSFESQTRRAKGLAHICRPSRYNHFVWPLIPRLHPSFRYVLADTYRRASPDENDGDEYEMKSINIAERSETYRTLQYKSGDGRIAISHRSKYGRYFQGQLLHDDH